MFTGVGGIADGMHRPGGVAGGDRLDHLPGERDLAGASGAPQPGQDRQAQRPGQERQLHDDPGDHPAVTEPNRLGTLGRAIVMPGDAEHLLARAFEQGVIDHHGDRRTRRQQPGHDRIAQHQPDRIRAPASGGEEVVRTAVMPHPFQPGAQQHPAHSPAPRLRDQPHHQSDERAMTRRGETRPEHRQQRGQRG